MYPVGRSKRRRKKKRKKKKRALGAGYRKTGGPKSVARLLAPLQEFMQTAIDQLKQEDPPRKHVMYVLLLSDNFPFGILARQAVSHNKAVSRYPCGQAV